MAKRAYGEGSIYQRSRDKRWVVSVTIEGSKRKEFVFATQREAKEKLRVIHALQHQGQLLFSSSQRLDTFLDHWLQTVEPSVRPKTLDAYRLCVRRVNRNIGSVALDRLKPAHVQQCYAKLLNCGLSKRSVEQTHTVLRTALRHAVKTEVIGRNPTDAVTAPRPERSEMVVLTPEQVCRLFKSTREDRLHALWVVLLTAGCRSGEAVGLTWKSIDFDRGTLHFRQAVQRQRGKGLQLVDVKTYRSNRKVGVPGETIEALRRHQIRQKEECLGRGEVWTDANLVFTNKTGGLLDTGNVYESFQRRLKAAGVPRIRVHDCRHTVITHLLSSGATIEEVKGHAGHGSYHTLLGTYNHAIPGSEDRVAQRLANLFFRSAEESEHEAS